MTDALEDSTKVQTTFKIGSQIGVGQAAKSGNATMSMSVTLNGQTNSIRAQPIPRKTWGDVASCEDLVITCAP